MAIKKNPGSSRSERFQGNVVSPKKSATKFHPGSKVKVRFGGTEFPGKVLGLSRERITVKIQVDDAGDPIVTSFMAKDIKSLDGE